MTSTCHTPRMHAPQRLRVELEQRISTHEETLGKAVRTRHDGSTQAHHLTAIWVRGRDSYNNNSHASSGVQALLSLIGVMVPAFSKQNRAGLRKQSLCSFCSTVLVLSIGAPAATS